MEQNEYWDSVAEEKEFTTPFDRALFENAVPDKAALILDVGCGYGRALAELRAAGYENLTGVDFSENLLARGRRENPGLRLQSGSATSLPFESASFDAVLLFAVLTCCAEDAVATAVVEEASRVLKRGGAIYVNDFLLNDDARNLERYDRWASIYGYGVFELSDGARLRHYSESRARALLAAFETIRFEKTIFATMNGHTSNGFVFLGRKG